MARATRASPARSAIGGLRPHCEACRGVKGRDTIEIDHPAGEEIQWDWFERRKAPWGGDGLRAARHAAALGPHPRACWPSRWTRRISIEAMDEVMRRLGGTARDLAHRPPGDGDRARHSRGPGELRPGRQALRGDRRAVPAAAGQPKGRGRVLRAVLLGSVVAHDDAPRRRRTPSVSLDRFLRDDRRCPGATARRRRRARPSGRWPMPSRCMALPSAPYPGDDRRRAHRRRQRDGRLPGQPLLGATGARGARCSRSVTASGRRRSRSMPPSGALARHATGSHRPAPASLVRTPEHRRALEAGRALGLHHAHGPVTARRTGRPGTAALAEAATPARRQRATRSSVDLAGYAELDGGDGMSEASIYQQLREPPRLPAPGRCRRGAARQSSTTPKDEQARPHRPSWSACSRSRSSATEAPPAR